MKPTDNADPASRLRRLPPAPSAAVVVAAVLALATAGPRLLAGDRAPFPGSTAGWSLAVLTLLMAGHLAAMDRLCRWGGAGSGAALPVAVLLLYGWVPAVLTALALTALVDGAARRRPLRAVLHGAVDVLGLGAGALVLAAFHTVPSVEHPWRPDTWGPVVLPEVVLTALVHLAVVRALLRWSRAPRDPHPGGPRPDGPRPDGAPRTGSRRPGGRRRPLSAFRPLSALRAHAAARPPAPPGTPPARTGPAAARALVARQVPAALALLGVAPLICVVAVRTPVLLPLFAVPLIALDSAAWIARARAEERLRDPLTGLPNRQWLLERARAVLRDTERTGARAALVLVDLDRFRSVNDTLGHPAGDRLLRQTADRLRRALPAGAEAARLGADEFAVLLPAAGSAAAAERVARALVAALGSPLDLDGVALAPEASAGLALAPDHACDAEGLLRRADVAMYQAKRDHSGVEVYRAERDGNTPDRLGLLGDLRRALETGGIELHYQPKVGFDGRVAGLEALLRWVRPGRGRVSPDEFIATAESSGLMPRLTAYVLETAIGQIARWREAGLTVPVAVNVSARDVRAPGFAAAVAARLARHGVPPGSLQLEITEHALLDDPQGAADTLAELAGHGVRTSLDDFGTGYSSLVHLRRLPVSELKIDRSFVARLTVDDEDAEIVRCTVDLAHSLGLLVVAEGVEDDETWERLRDLGCDAVQGWLVAAAMPPEEATAWLRLRGKGGRRRRGGLAPAPEHAAADGTVP